MESTSDVGSIGSIKKANYALGYLNSLRDIMSDSEINNLVEIDLYEFANELEKIQKSNTEKITTNCSNMSTSKRYLLSIVSKL